MSKAVIYIRVGGAPTERQEQACLDYCDRHHYRVDSVTNSPAAAADVVEAGVQVVVTAHGGNDDSYLDRRVRAAGGRLEYVRPPRGKTYSPELVAGMFERGADVATIAHLLDARTDEIRVALRQSRARHIR